MSQPPYAPYAWEIKAPDRGWWKVHVAWVQELWVDEVREIGREWLITITGPQDNLIRFAMFTYASPPSLADIWDEMHSDWRLLTYAMLSASNCKPIEETGMEF